MKNGLVRKSLVLGIIMLFVGTSVVPTIVPNVKANPNDGLVDYWSFDEGSGNISHDSSENGNDSLCYGFIVPFVKCENVTIEDQINCNTRNMINDLLREQIPVYWMATNITVSIKNIDSMIEQGMFFARGTFIIPFTGNNTQDTKIVVIVCDYNFSSEIEENNIIKIPVYELMEQLNTSAYRLSEVKIAQYKSLLTSGEMCLLEIAIRCGFLNFEFLNEATIAKKLNKADFNVIAWPGAGAGYSSFFDGSTYSVLEDIKYNVSDAIRRFVSKGGGYTGSCYGAYKASCSSPPLSIFYIRAAYNPKLHSIGDMSISDVFTKKVKPIGLIQAKIVNDTHPVTYGLDPIVIDLHGGGPNFTYIGKNSQVIANFYNTNGSKLEGTPSWVSSKFGEGKVVLFSTHPEVIGGYFKNINKSRIGRTIISNTLYYTTSKGITGLNTPQVRDISFIIDIWSKTANLKIGEPENIFDEIKKNINESIVEMKNLNEYLKSLRDLILKVADEKNIDKDKIGYLSINEAVSVSLPPFFNYFENDTKKLTTLEKVYPILKNDTNFVQKIEALKNDLTVKIKIVKDILLKSNDLAMQFEKSLIRFQKRSILSDWLRIAALDKAHKFYREIFNGYYYIPQTYLNSSKFLRTSWYNYEANIAI